MLLAHDGIDPNARDNLGQTPLHLCMHEKRREVMSLLLAHENIAPDTRDNSGNTPLHVAASQGYRRGVRYLLRRPDVDPESRNSSGRTPLQEAVKFDDVRRLIAKEVEARRGSDFADKPDSATWIFYLTFVILCVIIWSGSFRFVTFVWYICSSH